MSAGGTRKQCNVQRQSYKVGLGGLGELLLGRVSQSRVWEAVSDETARTAARSARSVQPATKV